MMPAHSSGSLLVRERVRHPVGESLWHDGELGVAAVSVPPGVLRLLAEVLAAAAAPAARAAGVPEPGDADPVACGEPVGAGPQPGDLTHHLVARHGRGPPHRQVAFSEVQVCPAHAADPHPDEHLPRAGRGKAARPAAAGVGPAVLAPPPPRPAST